MLVKFVISQLYDGYGVTVTGGRNFYGDHADVKFNDNVAGAWHYGTYVEAENSLLNLTVEGVFRIDRIFVNLVESVSYKFKHPR